MGRRRGPFATHNPWTSIALTICFSLTVGTALVGFVVLPIANRAEGEPIWTALCTAFGLTSFDTGRSPRPSPLYASMVRWTPREIGAARSGDPHAGAFVALDCAACHGEGGVNRSGWIPNLAGMRRETIVKQLLDYGTGHRVWPVMNGIGQALSRADMENVAAYYAGLPATGPGNEVHASGGRDGGGSAGAALRLVVAGDAARGIAPCGSCHGLGGLKRAAPVLAGQQASYIERQLNAFQMRTRANDEGEQMRVVAASLTPQEIKDVAAYLSVTRP